MTGSSRGIGAEIARELARQGANVAIVYHSQGSADLAQNVAFQITGMGRKTVVIKADLRELDCGDKIVMEARKGLQVDKIDILVNNAGADAPPSTALEFDPVVFET